MRNSADQPADAERGARDASRAAPLLEARQLAFHTDTHTLWQNLHLDLRPGERLAVTGASGTGKTLLLRTLAGLEPLTAGDIRYRGRPLSDWFMPEFRSRVVYVPQNPRLREGSVTEVLEAPFRFRVRRDTPFPAEAVRAHLAAVGRKDTFLAQRAEQLSGGEAQLVTVLRALVTGPEVLLLDEPTASLDDAAARSVESLVARWLADDSSRACIWTSHDADQLARVCQRAICLEPCP